MVRWNEETKIDTTYNIYKINSITKTYIGQIINNSKKNNNNNVNNNVNNDVNNSKKNNDSDVNINSKINIKSNNKKKEDNKTNYCYYLFSNNDNNLSIYYSQLLKKLIKYIYTCNNNNSLINTLYNGSRFYTTNSDKSRNHRVNISNYGTCAKQYRFGNICTNYQSFYCF